MSCFALSLPWLLCLPKLVAGLSPPVVASGLGGGQLADQSPLACLLSFMLTSQTLGSQDPYPCHRLVTQGHCCCSCQKPLSVFECFQGQTEGFMSRPRQSLPLWSLARCQTPLNLFPHL